MLLQLPKLKDTGQRYTVFEAGGGTSCALYTLAWGADSDLHSLAWKGGVSRRVHEAVLNEVTETTFDFAHDGTDRASLMHLAHLAESTAIDPLLRGLMGSSERPHHEIVWSMVRAYFWLLGEHLHPRRDTPWHQLAGILWWNERVGSRWVARAAGADRKAINAAYPQHAEALAPWFTARERSA